MLSIKQNLFRSFQNSILVEVNFFRWNTNLFTLFLLFPKSASTHVSAVFDELEEEENEDAASSFLSDLIDKEKTPTKIKKIGKPKNKLEKKAVSSSRPIVIFRNEKLTPKRGIRLSDVLQSGEKTYFNTNSLSFISTKLKIVRTFKENSDYNFNLDSYSDLNAGLSYNYDYDRDESTYSNYQNKYLWSFNLHGSFLFAKHRFPLNKSLSTKPRRIEGFFPFGRFPHKMSTPPGVSYADTSWINKGVRRERKIKNKYFIIAHSFFLPRNWRKVGYSLFFFPRPKLSSSFFLFEKSGLIPTASDLVLEHKYVGRKRNSRQGLNFEQFPFLWACLKTNKHKLSTFRLPLRNLLAIESDIHKEFNNMTDQGIKQFKNQDLLYDIMYEELDKAKKIYYPPLPPATPLLISRLPHFESMHVNAKNSVWITSFGRVSDRSLWVTSTQPNRVLLSLGKGEKRLDLFPFRSRYASITDYRPFTDYESWDLLQMKEFNEENLSNRYENWLNYQLPCVPSALISLNFIFSEWLSLKNVSHLWWGKKSFIIIPFNILKILSLHRLGKIFFLIGSNYASNSYTRFSLLKRGINKSLSFVKLSRSRRGIVDTLYSCPFHSFLNQKKEIISIKFDQKRALDMNLKWRWGKALKSGIPISFKFAPLTPQEGSHGAYLSLGSKKVKWNKPGLLVHKFSSYLWFDLFSDDSFNLSEKNNVYFPIVLSRSDLLQESDPFLSLSLARIDGYRSSRRSEKLTVGLEWEFFSEVLPIPDDYMRMKSPLAKDSFNPFVTKQSFRNYVSPKFTKGIYSWGWNEEKKIDFPKIYPYPYVPRFSRKQQYIFMFSYDTPSECTSTIEKENNIE